MMIRSLKGFARKLANSYVRLLSIFAQRSGEVSQVNIEKLRHRFTNIPVMETSSGTESERKWNSNMNILRSYVLNRNPSEFLRWDVIRRTMFVDNAFYINKEYAYLKNLGNYKPYWENAIQESQLGDPIRYWKNNNSSGNIIHHAYHLANYELSTNKKICDLDLIIEFGGGYGSLCRVVHQLGFKGRYVIFDLPNFSALQEYYLESLKLQIYSLDSIEKESEGIFLSSNLQEVSTLLKLLQASTNNLFIATWSMSETPIHIREQLVELIRNCASVLIGYQEKFGEVDNIDYFSQLQKMDSSKSYKTFPIVHLPENHYFVGVRK